MILQKISFGSQAPVSTESFEVALSEQPAVFDAYYTTQLSSVYTHYQDAVNKKRKLRAPPVRAYGTRHAAAEEALTDLESESVSNKRRRSAGDDEGTVSPSTMAVQGVKGTTFNLLQVIAIWSISGSMSANKVYLQSKLTWLSWIAFYLESAAYAVH